jgi:hypothetical protein
VYHKTPTTLEQASGEQTMTKVTYSNGKTVKYKYVVSKDGQYYGTIKESGQWIETPLDLSGLDNVFTKNKSGSTWATVALIAIPVLAAAIIIPTLPWLGDESFFPVEDSNL